MSSAIEKLTSYIDHEDPYDYDPDEIDDLRLAAAAERFETVRAELPILDQRASDVGIQAIERFEDLVPLLFAHSNYKSYPEAFMEQGRWDRMNMWLDTLSTNPGARDVDVTGVVDVDDWLARLHSAGHFVFATSGTTGKCSFLDQGQADRDVLRRIMEVNLGWGTNMKAQADRPVFILGPSQGYFRFIEGFRVVGELFGRPGEVHYLIDEPVLVAETNRMGALRRAIANGTAKPTEIAAIEEAGAARAEAMEQALMGLVDTILERRHEPMIIMGMWPQHFAIAQAARERGIPDGDFHPETVIGAGGGRKGVVLPDDFKQQVLSFYGLPPERAQEVYGMSEMSTAFPMCTAGRFHCPPWIAPLILDKAGETLLDRAPGGVEGRMAFFDAVIGSRWGGLITGDKIVAHFDPCPCGRRGHTLDSNIFRYSELEGGEDKLTCAGTVESYVRGRIEL